MLSFDINQSALGVHDWSWDGQRWNCEASRVRSDTALDTLGA